MSEPPLGWAQASLSDLIAADGLFTDGDWVETKAQDPAGAVRLTQLADVGDGYFRDRSRRYLRDDQAERLNCTYLVAGDVLVARMPDPLGRACIFPGLPQLAVTAVDVCIVRPGGHSVDGKWLMWAINSPQFRGRIDALQTGTTRRRISRRNLASVPLSLPPLAEQRRIVAAIEEQFSRLDAGHHWVEEAVPKLRALREAVLSAGLADDWPRQRLGELATTSSGGTPSRRRPELFEGAIPWVKSGELGDGRVAKTDETISQLGLDQSSAKIIEGGTLLIALYGATVGKLGLLEIDAATNQAVCAVRPDERMLTSFLWLVLGERRRYLVVAAQGGAQPNISQGILRNLLVPVPPLEDQRRIVAELEQQLSLIDSLRAAVESAQKRSAALRRSILERAFRGELVREDQPGAAEDCIEELGAVPHMIATRSPAPTPAAASVPPKRAAASRVPE